jgi:hypothetical protein
MGQQAGRNRHLTGLSPCFGPARRLVFGGCLLERVAAGSRSAWFTTHNCGASKSTLSAATPQNVRGVFGEIPVSYSSKGAYGMNKKSR